MTKYIWQLRPIPTQLNAVNVWEHTPASYYQYGEYPRFIRPARDETRVEWVRVPVAALRPYQGGDHGN